jgi:hypothetical protein
MMGMNGNPSSSSSRWNRKGVRAAVQYGGSGGSRETGIGADSITPLVASHAADAEFCSPAEAGKNYAVRAGEKELASEATLEIPVLGEIIVGGMTIYNVGDGIWTAGKTAYEAGSKAYEVYQKIGRMKDELGKLADVLSKKTNPTDLWADAMTGMAYPNPCLQAKRCQLVPYNATKAAQQARSGKGCRPGQTGHDLLPSEMFEDCKSYTKAKEAGAPTVCVEGVNNTQGSHGLIHGQLEKQMQNWRREHGLQVRRPR